MAAEESKKVEVQPECPPAEPPPTAVEIKHPPVPEEKPTIDVKVVESKF